MKNNKGVSMVEIIISIALISLIMIFLFRLLLLVRSEDNLNKNIANINVISSQIISDIHDDMNSKGLDYIYKPLCKNDSDPCCCSSTSNDCLKLYFKTGEEKELSVLKTNKERDSIKYGEIKRVLPDNYTFLSDKDYDFTKTDKFDIKLIGEGRYEGAPGYGVDSLMILKFPIYHGNIKYNGIEIRDGYNYATNGSLLSTTCEKIIPFTIKKRLANNSTELFWHNASNVTQIIFNNQINIPSGFVEQWDVSAAQDNSVRAFLVPDGITYGPGSPDYGLTTYILHIQANNSNIIANQNSSSFFQNFTRLTTINNLQYFDTSNVRNMQYMFANCSNLTSLNVSTFNTSNVLIMAGMFEGCEKLTTLNLSNFNTERVTAMSYMFARCHALNNLNISNFNTTNVTTTRHMFSRTSLTTIDIRHFNLANTTNTSGMFYSNSQLTSVNMAGVNTSSVTNMEDMFRLCPLLSNINMNGAMFNQVTTYDNMFAGATINLNIIVINQESKIWIEARLTDSARNGSVKIG